MALTIEAGRGEKYLLEHAVFDVNSTLTQEGQLFPGVVERMHILRRILKMHLLTADTYGTQEPIINPTWAVGPKIAWKIIRNEDGPEDEQKGNYVRELGKEKVVAIGNGMNDRRMLGEAKLGIAVLGPDGAAVEALKAAKVAAREPLTALDLLLHPLRLKASLRT